MWDTNWSRAHFIENHIVHQITAPNQFHRCSSCRRWSESLGTRDSIKYIPTLGMYSPDSFNILECHLDRMQFASAKLRFRSIATTLQWNAYYIHNNPHNTIIIIVHMPYIGFGMRSKPVSSLTILAIYHFVWYGTQLLAEAFTFQHPNRCCNVRVAQTHTSELMLTNLIWLMHFDKCFKHD